MSLVKLKYIFKLSKLGYTTIEGFVFFWQSTSFYEGIERDNIKVVSQFANYIGSTRSD